MSEDTAAARSRPLLADKVYHALLTRISHGEYGVNGKLPGENELAAQFRVSRPVLRSALERLRDEGLVYSRQGAGNFVRNAPKNQLGYTKVETIADIQRCYEFRLAIEVDGVGLAAARRNEAILHQMRHSLSMLSEATGSHIHREDADFAFHVAIAAGSNNTYHVETLKALRDHIHVGMKMHGESLMSDGPPALEAVLEEHRAIYNCVERQDVEGARDVMRQHILASRDRLFGGSLLDLNLS